MHRREDQRPPHDERDEGQTDDGRVDGEDVRHCLLEVVEDPPAQPDGGHDGREVVVEQDERRGFPGDVGPPLAHGHPDVRRFQGGRVVHAVAGHGHQLAPGLERPHQLQLLLGHHPREDVALPDALLELRLLHRLELGTGDHRVRRLETDLPGDCPRRSRVVSGDHDHPDAGGPALLERFGDRRAGRVGEPHQPQEGEVEFVLRPRPFVPVEESPGHSEHPQAVLGHGLDGPGELRMLRCIQMAQVGDGFGGALGRDDMGIAHGRAPHVGHGEQLPRQRILVDDLPVVVKVLGTGEVRRPEILEGLLHRVERVDLAGEDPVFHELVEGLENRGVKRDALGPSAYREEPVAGEEPGDRHPVQRQGAGLVDAENGGRAERLHGRDPAGEDVLLADAPRAQSQKDGEHHRDLFRQRGHGQGHAGQKPLDPLIAGQTVDEHHEDAHEEPHESHVPHQASAVPLEIGRLAIGGFERLPDPAHLGARPGGDDLGDPLALHDQRPRVDGRKVIAARPGGGGGLTSAYRPRPACGPAPTLP